MAERKSSKRTTACRMIAQLTTKYYSLHGTGVPESMPLMCLKSHKFAVVGFANQRAINTFGGYKHGQGADTLAAARALRTKQAGATPSAAFAIHKLSPHRVTTDTFVE